jgi:hypothetical protein
VTVAGLRRTWVGSSEEGGIAETSQPPCFWWQPGSHRTPGALVPCVTTLFLCTVFLLHTCTVTCRCVLRKGTTGDLWPGPRSGGLLTQRGGQLVLSSQRAKPRHGPARAGCSQPVMQVWSRVWVRLGGATPAGPALLKKFGRNFL